jgi:hypothetical protein
MTALLQARRAYDHRLRDHVRRNGTVPQVHHLDIPRSTVATWRSRGPRPVVTLAEFGQDRQKLLARLEKLTRRERVLAAVVRLLLVLVRVSGFRLRGERLPAGNDKARVLRAITGAEPVLPRRLILRIVGIAPSRYHAWRRVTEVCGLNDRPSCPRTMPSQLTCAEVATVKDMAAARHGSRGGQRAGHGPRMQSEQQRHIRRTHKKSRVDPCCYES